MKNFIEAANQVKTFVDGTEGVMSVRCDSYSNEIKVHVYHDIFKELVEENSQPYHVTESEHVDGNIELSFTKDNVKFFTLVKEFEYEADFRSWMYDEPFEITDEEFYTGKIDALKESGHKLSDFA